MHLPRGIKLCNQNISTHCVGEFDIAKRTFATGMATHKTITFTINCNAMAAAVAFALGGFNPEKFTIGGVAGTKNA